MVYRLNADPSGPTRHIGARGALKQTTFVRYEKAPDITCVESSLEALAGRLLDLSHDVTTFEYQPFTLDVKHDRLLRNKSEFDKHRAALKRIGSKGLYYTPDFKVHFQDAAGNDAVEIQEWKDSAWVPPQQNEYGQKLAAARQLFTSHASTFQVYEGYVSQLASSPLAVNIRKLHSLKLQRIDVLRTLSSSYEAYLHAQSSLLSVVKNSPGITLGELAEASSVDVPNSWHLVIDEQVVIDIATAPLTPKTRVWPMPANDTHVGLFTQMLQTLKSPVWSTTC